MKLFTGKRLADGIAAIHAMWGVGAAMSIPAIIVWPGIQMYVFWPFATMASSWLIWKDCPLTKAEHWLRAKWDPVNHFEGNGFLAHYFGRLTGIRIPRPIAQRISYGYTAAVFVIILMV